MVRRYLGGKGAKGYYRRFCVLPAEIQCRRASEIEIQPEPPPEGRAVLGEGSPQNGARGIVAPHHAGIHLHPVDDVAPRERDCIAHLQAVDRARHVADLADEPYADVSERMNPEKFRAAVAEKGDLDREAFHLGRRALRQSQKSRKGIACALDCRGHDGIVERKIDEFVALGLLHDRLAVGQLRGSRAGGADDKRKSFGRPAQRMSRRHGRRLSGAGAWRAGRYGLVVAAVGEVQSRKGCFWPR